MSIDINTLTSAELAEVELYGEFMENLSMSSLIKVSVEHGPRLLEDVKHLLTDEEYNEQARILGLPIVQQMCTKPMIPKRYAEVMCVVTAHYPEMFEYNISKNAFAFVRDQIVRSFELANS